MQIVHRIPSIEEYLTLRKVSGLSKMSVEGASKGLPNTLFAVVLEEEGQAIGMGRVVGDGGLFFHITDICVRPEYQGKGYGKAIMREIKTYLEKNMSLQSHAVLFADPPADQLYAQYGFTYTAPDSLGMWWKKV